MRIMSYEEIALPLIERGIPVTPLLVKSKAAFLDDWQTSATTDLAQVQQWGEKFPDSNWGSVAKAELGKYWFFEIDAPEVLQRIETETGNKIPSTFRVRSSPGRGHFYFKQSPASIQMQNIAQGYVKHADWSARVNNQYVVAPGSIHPLSGKPYEIVSTAQICEAPQWLIDWLISQKLEEKIVKQNFSPAGDAKIPRGSHDVALTSIAGKMRHIGLEKDAIYHALVEICEKRCENYGPDYKEMCKKIAGSIGGYTPSTDIPVIFNSTIKVLANDEPDELEDQPEFIVPPYPKFPDWVMEGTSIYEGLVKPYCDVNSRYESFMFMPAMALMLNYLGTKIRIEYKDIIPSLYMVLIGRKGRVIKSSSVQDAIKYFHYAGILDMGNSSVRNAEGKTLVWTAGSPEGLGIDMQKTNCKNSVLFYDELSILTNKAGIDSSALVSALLLMYESGNFANNIKSKKDTFAISPGTYCASLIACTTDKNFKSLWGKMAGTTSGLNDRFFFLYQPEKFKETTPPVAVPVQEGSIKTRQLIDKAVNQAVYKIVDSSPLSARMNGDDKIENRQEIRAEKFALYFAVDMGLSEIDEDCIERALALVEYERQVKKYLRPSEALTKEAGIQNDIVDFLMQNPHGVQSMRDLYKNLHPNRYGTTLWNQSYYGLVKSGQIAELGTGKKSDPKRVVLMRPPEEEDD